MSDDGLNLKSVDKPKLLEQLLVRLHQQLQDIEKSAAAAHGGAIHEDAVAKSKYDTHGLELSYLAGSQRERAQRLQAEIKQLEQLNPKRFEDDDAIDVGALVCVKQGQKQRLYFLLPYGSGLTLSCQGHEIHVISPESPLGGELLDGYVGDEVYLDPVGKQRGLICGLF